MTGTNPTRALQIGFLVLLLICVAQVTWWIADQSDYAQVMMTRVSQVENFDSATLEALQAETRSRINRYRWEGGFFLLVLIAGMAVLTRAIRQDAELRRRQQNFLAAVSHEFKSPLASMRLAAETLLRKTDDPDTQRLGGRILDDGERLLRMVDNLLDTTRLEEGRPELQPEALEVGPLVDHCVDEIRERAASHGIEIRVNVEAGLTARADRIAFETVLRNLLDNAIKAAVAGNGHSLAVQAAALDSRVELRVSDDGLGFARDDASTIFEKFHRLGDEQRRSMPGTGLGLYIVRRLVNLSDGRVRADSDGPGRGATITVTWPRAA